MALGVWQHLAVVYDGTQASVSNRLRFYHNGVEISYNVNGQGIPQTIGGLAALTTSGVRASHLGFVGYFTGSLDEQRVYNKALSASEVWHLYNLQQ